MIQIRYLQAADRPFWFRLDRHLPEEAFARKVRDREGYVLLENGRPAGLLRWNFFWDQIPFCSLLFVEEPLRGRGCGGALMGRWESDMAARGLRVLMTSTQADESAQHFYRRLGYRDAGCLLFPVQSLRQPAELFLMKELAPPGERQTDEGERGAIPWQSSTTSL